MNERVANRISVCAVFLVVLVVSGCMSIWKDVPNAPANPVVRLDATWFMENPSKDLIQRIAEERRQHISSTLADRAAGKTGVPLEDAIGVPVSDASAPRHEEHQALVLDRKSASEVQPIGNSDRAETATTKAESSNGPLVIEFADGRTLTGEEDEG